MNIIYFEKQSQWWAPFSAAALSEYRLYDALFGNSVYSEDDVPPDPGHDLSGTYT